MFVIIIQMQFDNSLCTYITWDVWATRLKTYVFSRTWISLKTTLQATLGVPLKKKKVQLAASHAWGVNVTLFEGHAEMPLKVNEKLAIIGLTIKPGQIYHAYANNSAIMIMPSDEDWWPLVDGCYGSRSYGGRWRWGCDVKWLAVMGLPWVAFWIGNVPWVHMFGLGGRGMVKTYWAGAVTYMVECLDVVGWFALVCCCLSNLGVPLAWNCNLGSEQFVKFMVHVCMDVDRSLGCRTQRLHGVPQGLFQIFSQPELGSQVLGINQWLQGGATLPVMFVVLCPQVTTKKYLRCLLLGGRDYHHGGLNGNIYPTWCNHREYWDHY